MLSQYLVLEGLLCVVPSFSSSFGEEQSAHTKDKFVSVIFENNLGAVNSRQELSQELYITFVSFSSFELHRSWLSSFYLVFLLPPAHPLVYSCLHHRVVALSNKENTAHPKWHIS